MQQKRKTKIRLQPNFTHEATEINETEESSTNERQILTSRTSDRPTEKVELLVLHKKTCDFIRFPRASHTVVREGRSYKM